MKVRAADATDRESLVSLFEAFQEVFVKLDPESRELCEPGYGTACADALLDYQTPSRSSWVFETQRSVVGVCSASWSDATSFERLSNKTRRRGRIDELYVDETSRGQGIGKALLRQAEQWLAQAGCDAIRIEVFAANSGALRFYETQGYVIRDVDLFKAVH